MSGELFLGDCLEVLRKLPACSVDAMITDPPAGISFMGKNWDHDKGGRDHWIAWLSEVMIEAKRVLKPGGHALVWALPRTSHWTGMALENAGFEIRERIAHLFGTGFPKSADVSKMIDRAAGAERMIVGPGKYADRGRSGNSPVGATIDPDNKRLGPSAESVITAPATPEAQQWDGWGTALKPACEDWWLCRKPLAEATIAANVLKHGTGGINIDACRIGSDVMKSGQGQGFLLHGFSSFAEVLAAKERGETKCPDGRNIDFVIERWNNGASTFSRPDAIGRWPANVVLSHHPDCVCTGTKRVKGVKPIRSDATPYGSERTWSTSGTPDNGANRWYADADGLETVENWQCVENCPVKLLDEQSGESRGAAFKFSGKRKDNDYASNAMNAFNQKVKNAPDNYGDTGGASRFFYCAKASRKDRGEDNDHPTVKNTELMRYLIRLVTPPGGVVLDPFMGSGSTGKAALLEGFEFVGIERDEGYFNIARNRIAEARKQLPLFSV